MVVSVFVDLGQDGSNPARLCVRAGARVGREGVLESLSRVGDDRFADESLLHLLEGLEGGFG